MKITIPINKSEKDSMIEIMVLVFDIISQTETQKLIYRDVRGHSNSNARRMLRWLTLARDILRYPIMPYPNHSFDKFCEMYLIMAGEVNCKLIKTSPTTQTLYNEYFQYMDSKQPYEVEIDFTGFIYFDMAVIFLLETITSSNEKRTDQMRFQGDCYFCLSLAISELQKLLKDKRRELSNDLSLCKVPISYIKTHQTNLYHYMIDKAYFRKSDILLPCVHEQIAIRNYVMNPSSIPNRESAEKVYADLERRINSTPNGRLLTTIRENYEVIVARTSGLPS